MRKFVVVLTMTAVAGLAGLGLAIAEAEAGGRPLHASLSAENEVPPAGTGATGSASVTLNQGQGRICFDIDAEGLAGEVIAGHIHAGEAGSNGAIVVNFGLSAERMSGCVEDVERGLIKGIRRNPASFYVNVHTTAVPSGEIRGQLSK